MTVSPSLYCEPLVTLRLENLHKTYGEIRAVDGVSLALRPGETLALLGPSGCGKSTLLRLVAGLEPPTEGRIFLGDRDITALPPQRRGFGMVFQDYALFPHLNVEKNIAFGLVEAKWKGEARRARVGELLGLVGLEGFEKRRVFELSGGQQQRVALARSLAPRPALLLLDEPLSNLDAALRDELKRELGRILGALEVSALFVTHDQSEAFTVADRVAVMRAGRLEQVATPADLFAAPASVWVARFLGHTNVFDREQVQGLGLRHLPPDAPHILLRSDLISLSSTAAEGSASQDERRTKRGDEKQRDVSATLVRFERAGAAHTLLLELHPTGLPLHWTGFTRELPAGLEPGDTVRVHIPPGAVLGLETGLEPVLNPDLEPV